MLFKNDIFLDGGVRHRLLHADAGSGTAWTISLDDPKAWPVQRYWSELETLLPLAAMDSSNGQGPASTSLSATPAMHKARNKALEILGNITKRIPDIFDPTLRSQLVTEREQQGYSRVSVYKHLRRYWQGGQTPVALLGAFHRCGRNDAGVTAGRGAISRFGHSTYQVEPSDCEAFADIIERVYLQDKRIKISHAFQRLLEKHYQSADGNGNLWVKPQGERPSLKQFEYFLRTRYSIELRMRMREGNKDFERSHRAVLDTILSRCQGVGHQYEADATIADVYLVAKSDRRRIIGKPTMYFIIDRKSRLIVGWYVGLENSNWSCAMQALLTISLDKRTICDRYSIKYEPSDWPAHQVFPAELIADREMLQKTSDQIADDLATCVVNLPAQRPDHKPVVETQFKLTRMRLQDGTPGFDPPENAKRRMGKHYEKDACLTLDEFTSIILNAIIEHNRAPMKEYDLSLQELTDEVEPSPIALWNHNIVTRAGALTRYSEERVRLALLPRGEATVSEAGIEFSGCFYTCPEAIQRGWFVAARKRRFKLMVSYDGRLVDSIYVHGTGNQGTRGEVYACTLTPRSEKFKGLALTEVKAYEKLRILMTPSIEQGRIQARADFHARTNPIIDGAAKKLKAAGPKKSRTSRRADIKDDRQAELRQERHEAAVLPKLEQVLTVTPVANEGSTQTIGQVTSFQAKRAAVGTDKPVNVALLPASALEVKVALDSTSSSTPNPTSISLAEKARLMRERMRHG